MGGCATKPKDLKAETDAAPAPALAPENEDAGTVTQTKEVVVVEEDKEIVEVDKHRSLSNLFKESEEAKDSAENDKSPSETYEATSVDDPIDPREEKVIEVEKCMNTAQTPEKAEEKKPDESESVTETLNIETCVEKKAEEDKPATEETQQPEISEEKKAEEKEATTDIQTSETVDKIVTECEKLPEGTKTEK